MENYRDPIPPITALGYPKDPDKNYLFFYGKKDVLSNMWTKTAEDDDTSIVPLFSTKLVLTKEQKEWTILQNFARKKWIKTSGINIYRDKLDFYSVEQYFQAMKMLMIHKPGVVTNQRDVFKSIIDTASAKEAKRLGRTKIIDVNTGKPVFNKVKWEKESPTVLLRGLVYKFFRNEDLMNELVRTGDKILVEASPKDRRWGIGRGKNTAKNHKVDTWGQNMTGRVLMKTRYLIKCCENSVYSYQLKYTDHSNH